MLRLSSVVVLAGMVMGCAETDPYTRGYTWQPTGANSINIAQQVVNKNDLIRGRGVSRPDTIEAITPVFKLYEGKPERLPSVNSRTGGGG